MTTRKTRRTVPQVAVVQTAKEKKPSVTAEVLAAGRAAGQRQRGQVPVVFGIARHPPGVADTGPALAQDDALVATNDWGTAEFGAAFGAGLISEGQSFLGYAILAEMAQRPEYRRPVETIASHMVRRWIKITVKGEEDKSDKVAVIEEAMRRLKVREAFQRAAEHDGFGGRGHIFLDFGDDTTTSELATPIGQAGKDSAAKVNRDKPLRALRNVEAMWCYPRNYNSTNPLAPNWYRPQAWGVMGTEVHASRILTFVGREVPDILKPSYSFGGLSLTQMLRPYVDNWLRTRQSVSDLVHSFTVFRLGTNLIQQVGVNNGQDLFNRAQLFTALRDNLGLLLTDKDSEDFANVSAPLGGLELLQAQSQEHMAAVSGIPLVFLLGISPAGLNASSEGEIKVFYDWIHSLQDRLFRPNLTKVMGLVQLSEFGEVDPDIGFEFEPLWSLNEKELADLRKVEADTDTVLVDSGVISTLEARKRLAADPDTPYQGLDVEDVPEPPGETDDVPEPEGSKEGGSQIDEIAREGE